MTTASAALSTLSPLNASASVNASSGITGNNETAPSVESGAAYPAGNETSQTESSDSVIDTALATAAEINGTSTNTSLESLPVDANSTVARTAANSGKNETSDPSLVEVAETTTAHSDPNTTTLKSKKSLTTTAAAPSEEDNNNSGTPTPPTTTKTAASEPRTTTHTPTTTTTATTTTTTKKPESMQSEVFRSIEPETEADYKPELQWWKPFTHVAQNNQVKRITGAEEEGKTENGVGVKVVSMEPFTKWAGTEVEDRWPAMKNRLASAPGSASYNMMLARARAYGNRANNYNSYKVDLRQDHTHEPRWYDYLNARRAARPSLIGVGGDENEDEEDEERKRKNGFFFAATTTTSSPAALKDSSNSNDNDNDDDKKKDDNDSLEKQANDQRQDVPSKFRSAFSYGSRQRSPLKQQQQQQQQQRRWSPFNPGQAVAGPNLGTLWGLKPDPRNARYEERLRQFQRYQKLNDQGKAASQPKYIYPDAGGKVKTVVVGDSQESGSQQGQKGVSYTVKGDSSKVTKTALNHLGLQQKTIWSEATPTSSERSRARYHGE